MKIESVKKPSFPWVVNGCLALFLDFFAGVKLLIDFDWAGLTVLPFSHEEKVPSLFGSFEGYSLKRYETN